MSLNPNPPPPATVSAARERAYYLFVGALTLLLTSAPYVYAYLTTPRGYVYTGLNFNIDDSCVYLSWMQQAAAGHFFLRSLFSTEPQRGVLFNLFFWLLGTISGLTHIPAILVYHAARFMCGGLFLAAVAALARAALPGDENARARRCGFALVCFGAGLGWLWGGYSPARATNQPIDLWVPEAVSFLSLYFSPLFCAALALMVVFMTAVVRVEKSRRLRDVVPAMVAGALLGNFHSYDVIPLFTIWFAYRVVRDAQARRVDVGAWVPLIVVGLAALPTTLYEFWAVQTDAVFHARAFASSTPSPALRWDLLGLGLPLVMGVVGAIQGLLRNKGKAPNEDGVPYLFVYLVVGIAVAYIPISFQRKLLMGVQVPICLLAGLGLTRLTARLSGDFPKIAATFVFLLTVPSNALFVLTDIDRLSQNAASTSHRPYLKQTEIDALRYLRDHAAPTDAILTSPDASSQSRYPGVPLEPYLSVYIPALAGRLVYDGHWSETAGYGLKREAAKLFFRGGSLNDWRRIEEGFAEVAAEPRQIQFFPDGLGDTPDTFRRAVLKAGGIRYVLCDNRLLQGVPPRTPSGAAVQDDYGADYVPVAWAKTRPPTYLKTVFRNADTTIYKVNDELL